MVKGTLRLRLPNPHAGDIGPELLSRLLREAGISREDWERLWRPLAQGGFLQRKVAERFGCSHRGHSRFVGVFGFPQGFNHTENTTALTYETPPIQALSRLTAVMARGNMATTEGRDNYLEGGRVAVPLHLKRYSYRFAEQVLNARLSTKEEIERVLTDPTINVPSLSRPQFNRLLNASFASKGWQTQPPVFPAADDPSAKMDFLKDRVGVEVAAGQPFPDDVQVQTVEVNVAA